MRWRDGFIAVDWGTTNRRAYRLDSDGSCVSSMEDARGILSVAPGEFPAAAEEVRSKLGDLPLLLGGMVGSTRGWMETPYVRCPASINDVAKNLCWVDCGNIAIVPGVSVMDGRRADVMRGEEVQLFGALSAGTIPQSCLVGHPGTHNKWIIIRDGCIANFHTVMTGELFGLLRHHSILAEMLTGVVVSSDAFREGVRRGMDGSPLSAELFSVRAAVLLGEMAKDDAPSYLSGLLIGADISVGLRLRGEKPMLFMGDPDLTRLYATAAELAGHKPSQLSGEDAFLAGARNIGRMLS